MSNRFKYRSPALSFSTPRNLAGVSLMASLLLGPSVAQAAALYRSASPNQWVDGSTNYTGTLDFTAFASDQIVTDVNARVTFSKCDGGSSSCTGTGSAYANEIVFENLSNNRTSTQVDLITSSTFTSSGTGRFDRTYTFDQSAAGSITGYTNPPTSGTYRPVQSLDALNGIDPDGIWSLTFRDTAGSDPMLITTWSLDVTTRTATPNLNITTPSLNFGNVLVGDSGSRGLRISNDGESRSRLDGTIGGAGGEFGPGSATGFANLGVGGSSSKTYNYSPNARGSDSGSVQISSDGGSASVSLSGTGVAPVNQVDTGAAFDFVRIGTSETGSVGVQNIGDGNLSGLGAGSNLQGSVASAGGEFSGGGTGVDLMDGESMLLDFDYTPTDHGADSQTLLAAFTNGSSDGTNGSQNQSISLTGTGVGPIFNSSLSVGGSLDFGRIHDLTGADMSFDVSNIEFDLGIGDTLQGLTLVDAYIEGPDADRFSLNNFVSGSVLSAGGGELQTITVNYDPLPGYSDDIATLVLVTDINAAFGETGDSFTYELQGAGAPTPPALALLLPGLLGGLLIKRRR